MNAIMQTAAAITAVAAAAAVLGSILLWARRITEGVKCQLRSDMLRIYYHNRDSGSIRQYEFENFTMQYEAYTAMGGNSFMAKIRDEVHAWKVVT